jgi:hypothetical protein
MHSGWRSSGRRLLAIGLGGLGIALSISPAGVVDAIDPSVRTLRNLGFGGAVAFGIVQVLVAVSGVLPASPRGTPTAEPMVCRLPAGGRRIRTLGPPRYGRWFSLEFSDSTPSPRNPTSMPATFRCCIPVCVSVRPSGFLRRGGSPPKISCGRSGRRPRIAARHEFDAGRHPVPAQSHNPTRPLGL